eukprot:evm.model.scf_3947.1 EVM.evm.TU.scf_3947.1   scf_3947:614-6150(+)
MAGVARRLLDVPSGFVFWWSIQIAVLIRRVKIFNFSTPRDDIYQWAKFLAGWLRADIFQCGDVDLHKGGKCIYLCNHRSWADFFMDVIHTGGRAAALGRRMVLVAFPSFMSPAWVMEAIFFFNRNDVKDKEKFNLWIDKCWGHSPYPGLVIFPEGHRNIKLTSLPLKRGMLRYAFSRKVPCQCVIASGKEDVLSEKEMHIHFGAKIVVGYSEVIRPEKFPDVEGFIGEVQRVWDKTWTKVFTKSEDIRPLEHEAWGPDFSFVKRIQIGCALGVTTLIFLCVCAWMAYATVWTIRAAMPWR